MYLNITEAAKLAGVSRNTLYRAIKSGKLSSTDKGIDVAELERVYGPLRTPRNAPSDTRHDAQSERTTNVLAEQIEFLREQLRQAQAREERLMGLLEQAQRALTHQGEKSEESAPDRGPWGWFRRK
jgi:DNA-binding transcriptional MerR regulator